MERIVVSERSLHMDNNFTCSRSEILFRVNCCIETADLKYKRILEDLKASGQSCEDILVDLESFETEHDVQEDDSNNNEQCVHGKTVSNVVSLVTAVSNKLLHIREQTDYTKNLLDNLKTRLMHVEDHRNVYNGNMINGDSLASVDGDVQVPKKSSAGSTIGWKERPLIMYKNPKRNRFNQTICCVLLTEMSDLQQGDILIHASDTDYDLAACLESNDEQIMSCVVFMEAKTSLKFQAPTFVYLPVLPEIRSDLIPKIKFLRNTTAWSHRDTVQDLVLPEQKDVILRGCEIPKGQLETCMCVAVAVPPFEDVLIGVEGREVTLQKDSNIQLSFPPNSFLESTQVQMKTRCFAPNEVKDATRKYLELENVRQASTLVSIKCAEDTKQDVKVTFTDFGGTGTERHIDNSSLNWLINNLEIESISNQLSNVFPESFSINLEKEDAADKRILLFLNELESSSETTVDMVINLLRNSGQTEASDKINEMKYTWSENSSDFDPEFEQPVGTVKIVSKTDNHSWRVTPVVATERNCHTVVLERGHSSYSILGLVVQDEMLDTDVCKAASVLEDVSCLTNVSLVVRQNKYNPDKVAIHCVKTSKMKSCLSQLSRQGFTIAPTKPFSEFGMADGEQVEISFDEFCLEGYEKVPFSMTFYSGLDTAKYHGRLCILHSERHIHSDRYSSQMSYRVVSPKVSVHRTGSVTLHLPKPTDEQIGYFCYSLDFTVTAMAKYLALKLTNENANSTRWIKCAKHLTTDAVYHSIIDQISKTLYRPSERQRCEAFLLYWANHYVYPHENKIERMIDVFDSEDSKNRSDAHQFIRPFLVSGTLSNEGLRLIAKKVCDKWEVMGKKLGLSQSTINEIKATHETPIRQSLKMLDIWRLSDSAIMKETDIVKHLHECAKAAKCSSSVLKTLVGF